MFTDETKPVGPNGQNVSLLSLSSIIHQSKGKPSGIADLIFVSLLLLQLTGGGTGSAADAGTSASPSFVPFNNDNNGGALGSYGVNYILFTPAILAALVGGAWIVTV
jgi:hypothetical protein